MSKVKKDKLASLALAGLSAVVASGIAFAGAGMTVDSNGGLEVFELEDTDYWFKIGGRLHLDTAMFEGGETDRSRFPSGSHIRRARLGLKGGVGNNWVYKMDIDAVDQASNARAGANPGALTGGFGNTDFRIGEAFIAYNGCPNLWLALGQISVPYSLENWGSPNSSPFMELSMPIEAFAPTLKLGGYAEWHGSMVTVAGAVFHPSAGITQRGDWLSTDAGTIPGQGVAGSDPGSDPIGVAGRVTFSPVHDDHTVYHVGVSYRYENVHDNANNANFFTGMEVRGRQTLSLFSNIPPNSVEDFSVFGVELAGRFGPFQLAGEYVHAHVEREPAYPPAPSGAAIDPRNPADDLRYDGYYIMASYVLTGESKDYDFVSGTFGRVHPKSSKGAWEVLLRHSYVKLLDLQEIGDLTVPWTPPAGIPIAGNPAPQVFGANVNDIVGNAHSTTVGVTWWVNDNVRFMGNYSRANLPENLDINMWGFRAQVNW